MTDSQIRTAAERCWIDAETPVKKPQSSEWTKLGDAAPAKRIAKEHAASDDTGDIDTSAMILLSGEFEVVDDGALPSKEELAAARPPRLASKLFVVGLAMLAGGGLLAHRYVPRFDAEMHSIVAAMRPAPMPTPSQASPSSASAPPAPIVATVTSSATLAIVPKMPAPAPKMREPSAPPPAVAETTPKPKLAQAKPPLQSHSKAKAKAGPKAKRRNGPN